MQTQVLENDPQAMFHQTSDARVPEYIEKDLTAIFGRDRFGDPVVRVRFDKERFKEGCWIVEEKWGPEAFGSIEDWKKTQVLYDTDGTKIDFGDFPSRGMYASIMLWVDENSSPKPLSNELIERLQFQKQMREQKSITPEQVAAETTLREAEVERIQNERFKAAQDRIAEDMKLNADKILTGKTRVMGLPTGNINRILTIH